jgi:NAD(P)-dependent dehydrogenase (short-subunit alcohol dehydrogenase family)
VTTSLSDRVAVVTGGSSGIGAAVVRRLGDEGAIVFNLDAAAEEGERSACVDVCDAGALDRALERVVLEQGRLDICVANAGVSPTIAHAVDLDPAVWRRVVEINLTGTFLTFQAAARQMLRAGNGGRLIATASVAGMAGEAGASAYCAAKFGIRGLVESMARELAPAAITVNAVAPGEVDTPLHEQLRELHAAAEGVSPNTIRRRMEEWIPAARLASPSEIAGAFAYLASDEAVYVTGTVLVIDGGQLLV